MSTTIAQARELMYSAAYNGWIDAGPDPVTPFLFDNETRQAPAETWVRFSVRHNDTQIASIGRVGKRKFDRSGIAMFEIFGYQWGNGFQNTDDLVQRAIGIFEGSSIAGSTLRFNQSVVRELGPNDKYFVTTVDASFVYTEIR